MAIDFTPTSEGPEVRLAIVLPIIAPYARPIFEHLSTISGIELKIFVLKSTLPHRRGWAVGEKEAFSVEVVGARVQNVVRTTPGRREFNAVRLFPPFGLAAKVGAWRPNVVMCTDLTAFVSLLPLKIMRRCPIGLLVEETELTASQLPRWLQNIRAFMYRRASFWIPYGEAKKRYLKGIGIKEKHMFPAPFTVDNALYRGASETGDGRPHNPLQWITVGQLVPRKGFKELIEAWGAQDPDFLQGNLLSIVGEGPSESDLQMQIRERSLSTTIKLLGHKSPHELAKLYHQSDAFVFPTLMDTWGLVVNEAMAAELPILCSTYAGCHFDLIHPENGMLFDPLNIEESAKAIASFWHSRERWGRMGLVSRNIISAYTPRAAAEAIASAAFAAVV